MKKKVLALLAGLAVSAASAAFAGNGDLIVNGNIGAGTSTPSQRLDVNGNIKGSGNLTVSGNVGIGTSAPSLKLEVMGGGIRLDSTGGTKPACGAAAQGAMWFTQGVPGTGSNSGTGGTGTSDKLEICGRNSAGSYSWKTVATW